MWLTPTCRCWGRCPYCGGSYPTFPHYPYPSYPYQAQPVWVSPGTMWTTNGTNINTSARWT